MGTASQRENGQLRGRNEEHTPDKEPKRKREGETELEDAEIELGSTHNILGWFQWFYP